MQTLTTEHSPGALSPPNGGLDFRHSPLHDLLRHQTIQPQDQQPSPQKETQDCFNHLNLPMAKARGF